MSWQAYVDQLTSTGNVRFGAIISLQNCSVWAISPGFSIDANDAKQLVSLFGDPSSARSKGVTLNKEHYMVLKCDQICIIGKKGHSGGVCCYKSAQETL